MRIDRREPLPRVTIARRMQKDGAQYCGPYIGATAVRDALEVVRRVFPIRTCDKKLPLKAPARPCVNYEIGRCKAPCAQLCSQEEYAQIIDGVVSFLNGNSKEICDRLNQEMWAAAKKMDYELAAQKRDALRDVEGDLAVWRRSPLRPLIEKAFSTVADDDSCAWHCAARAAKPNNRSGK